MSNLQNWKPYQTMVQGGLIPGDHASGQFTLIAAGPPLLSNLGGPSAIGSGDVVYPIGLTQNLSLSQNRQWSKIFEIGSDRSVFIPGRTAQQLTLSRIYYSGPSLLRCLTAYYSDQGGEFPDIESLFDGDFNSVPRPYIAGAGTGGMPRQKAGMHDVKIAPGYGNCFFNLASDLFSVPIGLLLILRSSEESNLAMMYLEQCVIPNHSLAMDSSGLVIQESVGIQFDRLVPIRSNQIEALRGFTPADNPIPLTQIQAAAF